MERTEAQLYSPMDATNIAAHKIGAVAPRPKLPFFGIGATVFELTFYRKVAINGYANIKLSSRKELYG